MLLSFLKLKTIGDLGSGGDDDDSVSDENSGCVSLAIVIFVVFSIDEPDLVADLDMFVDDRFFNEAVFSDRNSPAPTLRPLMRGAYKNDCPS